MPLADKIDGLAAILGQPPIPANLAARLREVVNLRNWLVHGFAYNTTYLLDPDPNDPQHADVVDREDHVDWSARFPHLRFSPLQELGLEDGKKALSAIVDTFAHLASVYPATVLGLFALRRDKPFVALGAGSFETDRLIEHFLAPE